MANPDIEAALVVLAAKTGVDAEETRRALPRVALVPFDSEYKFMATFHEIEVDGGKRLIQLVKGGPDVVLARCSEAGGPRSTCGDTATIGRSAVTSRSICAGAGAAGVSTA